MSKSFRLWGIYADTLEKKNSVQLQMNENAIRLIGLDAPFMQPKRNMVKNLLVFFSILIQT